MMRLVALLCLLLTAFPAFAGMQADDVELVIRRAATRAQQISPNSFIAVVDREGYVLGVWAVGAIPTDPGAQTAKVAAAVSKAGTAAFLSSNQEALTSRSAGFIVQQNFPPGIKNRPNGPLVGVNFSNLPFSDVNHFKDPSTFVVRPLSTSGPGGTNGTPIAGTSLAGSPGGVPLYKNGILIGGVGVTGDGSENIQTNQVYDIDEDIALAGQFAFAPPEAIKGSGIFIDGIRVAYISSTTQQAGALPLANVGTSVPPYAISSSPSVAYDKANLGGVKGDVRFPLRADPTPGLIQGQARLRKGEVARILAQAAARARITRAGIRLPGGKAAQVFISVVGNPNQPGEEPPILGTFRTPDATIFSWDVSVQKARTALFYSNNERAFSSRTVGFLSQNTFPPGIVDTAPGPFFGMQERFSGFVGLNVLNGVFVGEPPTNTPPNLNVPNGITIFPGGFPLYRNGVLIGAIGVSGDGIEQDDLIAAAGTVGFQPPVRIRADRFLYRGARLPYAKFPRNPRL